METGERERDTWGTHPKIGDLRIPKRPRNKTNELTHMTCLNLALMAFY